MNEYSEVIGEFLVESHENLDQLDQDLVGLEQNPTEESLLASIFRTIHTIKGTCGFLGFSKLESIAHVGENLLSKLRDGEFTLNPSITSALLAMVDAIRQILACLETNENEGDVDYSQLVETLDRLQKGESVAAAPQTSEAAPQTSSDGEKEKSLFERIGGKEAVDATVDLFYTKVLGDTRIQKFFETANLHHLINTQKAFLTYAFGGMPNYDGKKMQEAHAHLKDKGLNSSHFDAVMENLGAAMKELNVPDDLIAEAAAIAESTRADVLQESVSPDNEQRSGEERRQMDHVVEAEHLANTGERREGDERRQNEQVGASSAPTRSAAEASIRVDVDILDRLMNLVGELVLARNQIMQFAPESHDSTFIATTQHLNLVTTELQEGVMKTRMQPIGNIWSKFPRVVRDLALSCNKKVRLEMVGKETELDKSLIEAIKDPLTHIVRNSVDHGIESPEKRKAAGKPEEGVLLLRAYHEGGQVNIEIKDDGAGIDPEKLKAKALSKHLITPDQAARMSDREIVNLVFAPGFSTAEKVTNVSGRGVGMDVVKTNIEKIGGTVDIQSRKGEGTTLKVKIPLTLAIIPALIIMTGGDRYAIPQVNLLELVRLEGEEGKAKIEEIQGSPVYRLRGNLLPLVYLNDELKVEKMKESDSLNIVVLQADDRQFGLVVEGISDTEEIVVKPLGKQLKEVQVFAGATIMGDGNVALILDVMGLAQLSRVITQGGEGSRKNTSNASKEVDPNLQELLILSLGENNRMAIPLSMVARLEVFKRESIEHSGDRDLVQYRGEIMPLVYLMKNFNSGAKISESETLQSVVYTHNGRSIGLVVDKILDIVEETITIKRSSSRKGVQGTIVIQDRVTDVLDVDGIVREADPTFFNEPAAAALTEGE